MIVCCGEALIDMIPYDLKNGKIAYIPKVGGAVLNTAISLGKIGAKISFLGSISKDIFGKSILEELKKSKVDTSLCMLSSFNSTLAFAHIENGTTTYLFIDENSANKNISLKNHPKLSKEVDTLYIGGISLMSEPSGEEIEHFINRESADKVVFFDPNIRPNFIHNKEVYMKRFKNILKQCDIIKVSHEDLEWIYPNEEFDKICDKWLKLGVSIVVLTKGSNGATAKTKTLEVNSLGHSIKVIDSIGAGDIFNAGFLFSLRQNKQFSKQNLSNIDEMSLKNSLNFANKAACISVSRIGANSPYLNEIDTYKF